MIKISELLQRYLQDLTFVGCESTSGIKYVHHNGTLTEKGIQALYDINEALCQDFGN